MGFYDCTSARLALLFYSIAKGVLASYGYFQAKGMLKLNLSRPIELLFTCLIMMLGITLTINGISTFLYYTIPFTYSYSFCQAS
jgi:hypothetical protein